MRPAESTIFERAVSTSPVCTPYRGCLLSGRYPSQTGIQQNGHAYPPDMPSLADHMRAAGYSTHYIGKWHLSGSPQENRWVSPEKRAGFQHFIGWESHHVDHYTGLIWRDDPSAPMDMPGHETDALTDIAPAATGAGGQRQQSLLPARFLSGAAPALLAAARIS